MLINNTDKYLFPSGNISREQKIHLPTLSSFLFVKGREAMN